MAIDRGDGAKEDTMVPGITDTECRMAEFRYRELLAEVDRQRRVDSVAPGLAGRVDLMASIQHCVGAIREQVRHLLAGVRTHEAADPAGAHGTVAMN